MSRRPLLAVVGMVVVCAACGRIDYDPLGQNDAGGMDAGGVDAGGVDAGGVDAGGADAGGVDSGGVDAAGVDAGGVDAGGVDVDAGGVDAGGGSSCAGSIMDGCPSAAVTVSPGMMVMHSGSTVGYIDQRTGSCGGAGVGELALQIDLTSFGFYTITATTDFDAVLYVRDSTCDGAENTCVNATVGPGDETYLLGAGHPGSWIVVVDGVDATACGNVMLQING